MTTAVTTTTTNSPRKLEPTAEYFPHDGAAFARLSPNKSLRNAAIIYESIKNLPDETVVRGDFDHKSRPFIFFPEALQDKEIKNLTSITSKNIEANRKEMHSFLSAIATDGFNNDKNNIQLRRATLELFSKCSQTMKLEKDILVGDIKASLKILAKAYYADQLVKKTSPHRLLGKQVSKIQNKRLREFIAIPATTALDICAALRKDHVEKYDTRPEIAFHVFKSTVKKFLNQDVTTSKSLATFVRQNAHEPDLQFFAKRWIAITFPTMTDERIQFSTEPWAKELDRVCEIIVKANRRSTRVMAVDEVDGSVTPAKLVWPQTTPAKLPLVTPKAEYSSLRMTDTTDDSSSFPPPPSPYKPSQSSSSSSGMTAAPRLFSTLDSKQSPESPVDTGSPKLSDYFNDVSQQDDPDSALSAQSTLSPTNEPKNPMSLGAKFKSQLSALSRNVLSSFESDSSPQQNENEPLLNDVSEESDQVIQSSHMEEKM
jgi:hypothetical protein